MSFQAFGNKGSRKGPDTLRKLSSNGVQREEANKRQVKIATGTTFAGQPSNIPTFLAIISLNKLNHCWGYVSNSAVTNVSPVMIK